MPFRSYEDLTNKILSLPTITAERLQENYDIISKIYSRPVLADKMLKFMNAEPLTEDKWSPNE